MSPDDFIQNLWEVRTTAILRASDGDVARKAMQAAVDGGFDHIEFTLTTPDVLDLIHEFSQLDGITVGAGTVLTPRMADAAVAAGAKFLVSPVVDEAVISRAAELGVAAMPGVHTPTEMTRAHRAGAQLQKLFPAPAGGPSFVRACKGPLPFLRIVPTNGVDEHNVGEWLAAGVWACGFVASLFDPQDMANGNYDGIRERAVRIRKAAMAFERGRPPAELDPFAA
jgi:2-dehydro-3-deoxyphosphogluconate aldolase/(4S)-4-hydroxy-2-oxoglutarate aldolase